MERNVDTATPKLPKLVKSMNPTDEQLVHAPDVIPANEPINDDLFIFNFVFFIT